MNISLSKSPLTSWAIDSKKRKLMDTWPSIQNVSKGVGIESCRFLQIFIILLMSRISSQERTVGAFDAELKRGPPQVLPTFQQNRITGYVATTFCQATLMVVLCCPRTYIRMKKILDFMQSRHLNSPWVEIFAESISWKDNFDRVSESFSKLSESDGGFFISKELISHSRYWAPGADSFIEWIDTLYDCI
jgi:hypothetical protein